MIISIHLDGSQQNIFYAGQDISGHVRVETNEEVKMRGIRLEVSAEAKVRWSEGSGNSRQTYTGHEDFFDLRLYLTGSDRTDSEMILKAGVHTFPLGLLLQSTCPSSFEGLHGSIRYKAKAVVDRPWRMDDSTEIVFTVIHLLNLNNELHLKEPIEMQDEKPTVGCCYHCCCIKGLPQIELRLNKGGFVPGDTIVVSGQVINTSNTKIAKTVINFVQEIHFRATSGGKVYHSTMQPKILATTQRPPIECGCTDTFNDVAFPVPAVVASRLEGCSIIDVAYYIQVKADFSRGCADSFIRQEVIIGHVPFQGDFQCVGPISTQPSAYPTPFQTGMKYPEPSNYPGVHNAGWSPDYIDVSVEPK